VATPVLLLNMQCSVYVDLQQALKQPSLEQTKHLPNARSASSYLTTRNSGNVAWPPLFAWCCCMLLAPDTA
jgi:hypothetical protein